MPNPALMEDYFFVGRLIQARLAAEIDTVQWQYVQHPVQILEAASGGAPSGFIYFYREVIDESPDGRAGAGTSQLTALKWTVVLMVRHASQVEPDATFTDAGPLLARMHRALSGWTAEGALRPLKRTNGPDPDSKPGGTSLFPQTFSVTLAL